MQTAALKKGITVVITEGFRSIEEQNELYRQGRSKKGNIVTYAKGGESYHNYGLAIDFALQKKDGSLIWDMTYDGNRNGTPDWLEVVSIAKTLGFDWGGDWRGFKDYPHLQMIPG
ncbi:peptidase M15 [Bacillus sp. CN2]|nr:peptidase M15 [Bacillus sp. CN2]